MRSVCTTIVVRPTCNGRVVAWTVPSRTPRKKLVFDSIVDVVAPSGRFKKAQIAPSVSANAMTTPPWRTPAVVHSSGRQASAPVTSPAAAAVSSMPSSALNGTIARMAAGSAASPAGCSGSMATVWPWCNGGVNTTPRAGAVALVAAAILIAVACSDDDDGADEAAASTTPAAATTATAPASSAPATTGQVAPTTSVEPGPSGPGCPRFPDEGRGSFAALAEQPAGTALSSVPRVSAMVAAIDAAGLLGALDGPGPLTIFAPVNAAFDAIPPAELEAMLTDTAALNSVLLYHALAERMSSADLAAAREVTTLEGQPLSFTERPGGLSINGRQARVVCADIETANATVHLIDGVLMPPPAETNVVSGTTLYSVDLATGAATRIGPIGDELGVIGMAIAPGDGATTVYGLTDVPELVTFDAADPAVITASVPITGVARGSSLLAIDIRPADGQLFALSDASVLYTIDPSTGVATAVGPATDPPVADPGFGFDVDPAADRIRVDVATGQNLSVDPTTAAATAHADLAYGDGDANAAATPRVVAAAYSPAADLFVVDVATGGLARQAPP